MAKKKTEQQEKKAAPALEEKKIDEADVETTEEVSPEEAIAEDDKDVVVAIIPPEEEIATQIKKSTTIDKEKWQPKTDVGRKVKAGLISDIDEILSAGQRILEIEITDILLPNTETDLLLIGQSKGKFGGGKRRIFKQTQKKTKEGNKPNFAAYAVIGDHDGHIGLGYGKSKETVPSREKAIYNAKKNVFKIRRGCGSWQCGCNKPHSIPFKVIGKSGSVKIELIPAPKGAGLKINGECQKILRLAGISDVWSVSYGKTSSRVNVIKACEDALKRLCLTKIQPEHIKKLGIADGSAGKTSAESADQEE